MQTQKRINPFLVHDPDFEVAYGKHQDLVVSKLLNLMTEKIYPHDCLVVDRFRIENGHTTYITDIWHRPTGNLYTVQS